MKRITTLAIICLSFCQLVAQNLPQGIAYQAVAVKDGPYSIAGQNPQAIYWSNKDINVRFTIYEKYPSGTNQFSETHATKTDDYGVFNLIIGQGNLIAGDFTKIPWDLGTAHLQVEIDFDNNGTYKLTSLERFWSVPYAFVTKKSSSTSTDSALNALNNKFNYLKTRDKDTVIGNEGGVSYKSLDSLNKVLVAKLAALKASDKDTVIGNELQSISQSGDTISLSNNGGMVIIADHDKQQLGITASRGTITLSNGGYLQLADSSSSNEIQTLKRVKDSLFISNGNGVDISYKDTGSTGIGMLNATTFSGSTCCAKEVTLITINVNAGKWVRIEGNMSRGGNCANGDANIGLDVISGTISNVVNSGLSIGYNGYNAAQNSNGVIYFKAVKNSTIKVTFNVTGGSCGGSVGGMISY